MISCIRSLVDSLTLPPLKYLDTVLLVTPAILAISSMVIFPDDISIPSLSFAVIILIAAEA